MKKIILFVLVAFNSITAIAQESRDLEPKANLAELRTKEIMDFFQLDNSLKSQILAISSTYIDKNASLEKTDMHEETIKMGKIYNKQQHDDAIKKLLSESQRIIFEKFENTCEFCKK